MSLFDEFERIKDQHKEAMKSVAARDALSSSVIRVFAPGTKAVLLPMLVAIDVDAVCFFDGQGSFKRWFEGHLETVAQAIAHLNPPSAKPNIYPGYKWGHAAKILNVHIKNVVLHSRYFDDATAQHISHWLYCPIDSYVIKKLNLIGYKLPFASIRNVATAEMFYSVQTLLQQAAAQSGIPAVWLDDNWGVRE